MWRLAILLWVMGGTVLAGVLVTVVLLTPALAPMKFIPIAAALANAVFAATGTRVRQLPLLDANLALPT